ncbi:MAG: hypothetical protein EB015_23355 [Methylocystaceae bacterium]|nr:hypothetical protein [Methylocystaceae bacterium]
MPSQFYNDTQIPAARVQMNDPENGYVNRPWYRFFYNLFVLLGSGSLRYGTFFDTTDQTAAAINTGYPVTFNNTDLSEGVYLGTPTSRIYVNRPGAYNFQFSLQLQSTSGASSKEVYIWARLNGDTDTIENSATKITIEGNNKHYVAAWNFVVRMAADDYFELMWATTNTTVQILADPATAFCPAIPSVIMTVTCNIGE